MNLNPKIVILDSVFYPDRSSKTYVGIVKAQNVDGYNEISFWVGVAKGGSQYADELSIITFGSRFPLEAGEALFQSSLGINPGFKGEICTHSNSI